MKPATKKAIEKTEEDSERLKEFLQKVKRKVGNPGLSPEDVEELLAEAEEFETEA